VIDLESSLQTEYAPWNQLFCVSNLNWPRRLNMGSSRDHLRRNVDLADAEYSNDLNDYLLGYEYG